MADILTLPGAERQLINWMMRTGDVTLDAVARQLGGGEADAQAKLSALIDKGFVRTVESHGAPCYQVRMAPRRKRQLPGDLWQRLDQLIDQKDAD